MSANRHALNVVIAVLDMEQGELAERMSYDCGYVSNIFNGFTEPSDAFKQAFGDILADLLLGTSRTENKYLPAKPLADFLNKRAAGVSSRKQFFQALGLSPDGWNKRLEVRSDVVDRVCCDLGVHPTAIYGHDYEVGEAS